MIPLQNFESFVWISVLNLKNQLDTSLQWFPLYQLCSPNSSLQMVSCKFASTSFHYCSSVVICFLISFISVFNCTKTHKPRIVLKEQGLSAALWTTISRSSSFNNLHHWGVQFLYLNSDFAYSWFLQIFLFCNCSHNITFNCNN